MNNIIEIMLQLIKLTETDKTNICSDVSCWNPVTEYKNRCTYCPLSVYSIKGIGIYE